MKLSVGDRIYRNDRTQLVVEAYDEIGQFIAQVPISVSIVSSSDVMTSRSDWDYAEAVAPGRAEIVITFACEAEHRAAVRVPIVVAPR